MAAQDGPRMDDTPEPPGEAGLFFLGECPCEIELTPEDYDIRMWGARPFAVDWERDRLLLWLDCLGHRQDTRDADMMLGYTWSDIQMRANPDVDPFKVKKATVLALARCA